MARSRRLSLIRDIMNDGARRFSTQVSRHWLTLDQRLVRDTELRKSLRLVDDLHVYQVPRDVSLI